jgi:hypothetical protein
VSGVELVREFWSLWRDDRFAELVARYDSFFTEELEWHSPVAEMAGRHVEGRAGFEGHVAELTQSFVGIQADPQRVAEIAPDLVRSDVIIHGEGPSSGVAADSPLVSFVRLRDGLIAWSWASFDLAAAERLERTLVQREGAEL